MDKVEEKFLEAVALSKELGIWQEPKQVGWVPGQKPKGIDNE